MSIPITSPVLPFGKNRKLQKDNSVHHTISKNFLGGFFILLCVTFFTHTLNAQEISRDSVKALIEDSPVFSIYKDNYFITGVPVNEKITNQSADAKFQISFMHRITNARLPFDSYLYLTYTQKSFWNIYEESLPFSENNYNPGLGLAKIIHSDDRFKGIAAITLDHESNGRDSIYSRSWNKLGAHYNFYATRKITVGLSLWIPFAYKDGNPDLLEYVGFGEATMSWEIIKNKLYFDALLRKGARWNTNGSLQTSLSFKFDEKRNQYIMLQWFTGHAENLIDYQKNTSMIRVGIVIKPSALFNY